MAYNDKRDEDRKKKKKGGVRKNTIMRLLVLTLAAQRIPFKLVGEGANKDIKFAEDKLSLVKRSMGEAWS